MLTRTMFSRITRSFFALAPAAPAALVAVAAAAAVGCGSSNSSSSTSSSGDSGGSTTGDGSSASGGSNATGGTSTASGGVIIGADGGLEPAPGSDDAGGDAGGGLDLDAGCGHTKLDASQIPVNVLLVVDKSASMTDPFGSSTDKWSALKTALASSLDQVKTSLSFGLELFPYGSDPACGGAAGADAIQVAVAPGTTSAPAIASALDGTSPSGGTPTAAALSQALDYFTQGAGATLVGDKYVLLATDGGPDCNPPATDCDATKCTTNLDGMCPDGVNCCAGSAYTRSHCLDDATTLARITDLRNAGVKTIVVGIPGTENYATYLDQFAEAGGAPNPAAPPSYFAVSASGGVDGLTSVLESITHQLINSCRLQLATQPPRLDLLNVYVDNTFVPQPGPDGWDLDKSTTPVTVVLKGATCANIEANGAQSVAIVYGCKTNVH